MKKEKKTNDVGDMSAAFKEAAEANEGFAKSVINELEHMTVLVHAAAAVDDFVRCSRKLSRASFITRKYWKRRLSHAAETMVAANDMLKRFVNTFGVDHEEVKKNNDPKPEE